MCTKTSKSNPRILEISELLRENSRLLDTLTDVIWLETSLMESENSTYSEPLADLLKLLVKNVPHTRGQLLESLDPTLLRMVGIINSEPDLQKKIRLTNTQQYYRQHKFNLLVEESEGFAKFLQTVLMMLNHPDSVHVDGGSTVLLRLMGTFSLDPNRCLDILLDILEFDLEGYERKSEKPSSDENPRLNHLLSLIGGLSLEKLPALLAFKLDRCKDDIQILRTAAILVHHKILDLSTFLTLLPDWVGVLQSSFDTVRKRELETIRAMGRVRLSSASNKTEEKAKGVDLSPLINHPTTQLLLLLLQWKQFSSIERLFESCWSMMCFLFPRRFGCLICDDVRDHLDRVEKTFLLEQRHAVPWAQNKQGIETARIDQDHSSILEKILSVADRKLGYTKDSGCIALRPTLFCKICRLLAAVLDKVEPSESCINFLRHFILPSIGLFKSQPGISREVWHIIERFPYETRYSLYSSWRGKGLERQALLSDKPLWQIQGELLAGKDARHALKRLSKDTIRDACRAIGKVCHSQPLVVFSTILGQIESYDNLVQVMADALRFATPLSLDVLGFCILGRLDGTAGCVNRSRLKDDGVNVSQWLQSLEAFIGALYKHFPALELGGIMSYLMDRVSAGHVMELGVLRMLLKESGGWAFADYAPAASLSSTQLEGRAGSTLLKRETMSFGVFQRFNKKAAASVRRVLLNDDVGVKLLILLSQLPNQIIFETKSNPSKPVKLIGNLVDTCQVTVSMLVSSVMVELVIAMRD